MTLTQLIRYIEEQPDPVAVCGKIISRLAERYDENRRLIDELLLFKYDLLGM